MKSAVTTSPAKGGGFEPAADFAPKKLLFFLAAVLLVSLVVRLPLLPIPFERDEGEYAYIGWRMAFGELPYRDWIDQKPPGVFWVYRLALCLPIEPVRSVHLVAAIFAAASASALYLVGRRFTNDFWAAVAGGLFGILCADPSLEGTAANTELLMVLPLVLSQLTFVESVSRAKNFSHFMLLSGLLTGLATIFKQVAAVNWPFLILAYPLIYKGEHKPRRTALFAALCTFGVCLVWALPALYFWRKGGWHDFIYNVFTHNLEYVGALTWADRASLLQATLKQLASSHAASWLFALIGLIALCLRRATTALLFLAGWFVTSAAGVSASGYFFPHYFEQLLPVLALTAALGGAALDEASFLVRFPLLVRRSLLVGALIAMPVMVMFPFLFRYSPEEAVTRIYPGNQFAQMPQLGTRLAEVTHPGDHVFIFGAEPELLFYARRPSATRYIFLFPLYGPYANVRELQIAASLEVSKAQPSAVFYLPNDLFFAPGSEQFFTAWSLDYLQKNFRADRWLTMDDGEHSDVIPGVATQSALADMPTNCIGGLFVRNTRAMVSPAGRP